MNYQGYDKTVSIVIPCRNEERYIERCIDSFLAQTYPKELFEVVICDGMSDDSTLEIIKKYTEKYHNIRVVNNEKISAPSGMNKGIKSSKSDVIIIFGAHAYADENFIKNNIELLFKDESIGCSGGPIETISEDDKGTAIAMAMSSPFGVGNALFRYCKEETFADTVAFGAYRKEVLNKIGYFDEELVRNQDDELNYRVVKNGYKILLSPKVKSTYYSRSSFKKLWKQYFQYGFWKVRVMQKHGKVASIRHLIPLTFVLVNIFGPILGIFFKPIRFLWFLEIGLYILLNIINCFKICNGKAKLVKYIFVTFPILHASYGLGFLEGLFTFYVFKSSKRIKNNTKLSR